MKSYFGTLFAALASVSFCEAYFARNESTYLNFHIPHTLRHNSSWPHVPSSFGRMGLGAEGSMVLPVKMLHMKDHHLCEPIENPMARNQLKIPADHGDPFMLLVEKGVCTYVQKARNAQMLGAAAVLIADTEHDHLPPSHQRKDLFNLDKSDPDPHPHPHPHPDPSNHTAHENTGRLADDGSGRDISIPAMMISKNEYLGLRKVIDNKPNETGIVVAEIAWHVPKFDWKVTMELWSSPVDWHTKEFLATNFSAIARTFDLNEMHGNTHDNDSYNEHMNLMRFRERPVLLDGKKLGCIGQVDAPDEPCFMMCTNNGRYCHASHHHSNGRDIVTESLRRMCITKHYNSPKFYWDYIDHFTNYCWDSDYFANEKCVDDAYKHSGIDKKSIESCFSDSGDPTKDVENAMLQDALDMARKRGVHQSPTVMINHELSPFVQWQGLSPGTVLYGLCETFSYGEKPHVCYACMKCGDPVACAKRSPMKCLAGDGQEKEDTNAHKEEEHSKKKGSKTHHKVLRWFFGLFLLGGCLGGYVYYKKQEENGGFGSNGGGGFSYSLQDAFLSDTN